VGLGQGLRNDLWANPGRIPQGDANPFIL